MKTIADANKEPFVVTPDGATAPGLELRRQADAGAVHFRGGVTSWLHSHPHEQIGYVVSGKIDFFMEGHEPARLTAGCSYTFLPTSSTTLRLTHQPS